AIERDFGSFEAFQAQLTEVAATVMGSGWGALVYEPIAQRLLTCQIYDHQSNLSQGGVALLVIDAWEHAYYLPYKKQKTACFKAVWNLGNGRDAQARTRAGRRLALAAPHTADTEKAAYPLASGTHRHKTLWRPPKESPAMHGRPGTPYGARDEV